MKSKILLFVLVAFVGLTGCKKDKNVDPLPDAKKQIIGTWKLQSATAVAYDASGKEVDRETQGATDDTRFQFVDESNGKIVSSNNEDFTYTITNVNGKITLAIESESFQVSFSNGMMIWTVEETYTDEAFTRKVTTIQFAKV